MYESVPDTASEPMDVDNNEAANQEENQEDKPANEVNIWPASDLNEVLSCKITFFNIL